MSARTGGLGLAFRQFGSSRGASATLASIVLLVALVATATPHAMQLLFTAGLQHAVDRLSPNERDLEATEFGGPPTGPAEVDGSTGMPAAAEKLWGRQYNQLEDIHDTMPPLLGQAVGEPQYTVLFDPLNSPPRDGDAPGATSNVLLGFDPWLESHVTIVDGAWPAVATEAWPGEAAMEIALSVSSARQMYWSIGETRDLTSTDTAPTRVTLVGAFTAIDPDDEFWVQTPNALEPNRFIIGLGEPIITGVGFANATSWPRVLDSTMTPRMHAWFPLSSTTLTAASSPDFLGDVREFTRARHANGGGRVTDDDQFRFYRMEGEPIFPVSSFGFTTGVIPPIEAENARATATLSVLSMAATGPIGVMIAVLILAVRLLLLRRAEALQIARARGASARRLRATLAAEGALIGVPAILAGTLVAPEFWFMAVLAGLLPAALLALWPLAARTERLDLGTPNKTRWIIEVVTLTLAAAGVVLLLQRGISGEGVTAFDPLLVATPLLLTLAACVLVLRLYPLPLALIARRAHGRRGLSTFLGAARGVRDQAAGLAPVLAMVVAVSIAVFSSVLLATTNAGITNAARDAVGADISVRGVGLDAAAAAATPGVQTVARVFIEEDGSVRGADDDVDTAVIAADTAALVEVQADVREGIRDDLSERVDGAIPVVISQKLSEALDEATELTIGGERATVVGVSSNVNPFTSRETWLIGDLAWQNDLVESGGAPKRLLIDAIPDADLNEVQEALEQATGATVLTSAGEAAALRDNPAILGLSVALVTAIALVGLLCGLAVVLTLVLGGRQRAFLLHLLRTLGLARRSERSIIAWEVLPVALVALVVGEVLGLALPVTVLAGVDLRQFTGGVQQPALVLDPTVPVLAAVVFAAIVLISLAVTTLRRNHD